MRQLGRQSYEVFILQVLILAEIMISISEFFFFYKPYTEVEKQEKKGEYTCSWNWSLWKIFNRPRDDIWTNISSITIKVMYSHIVQANVA